MVDRPTLIEINNNPVLQVPYDVEFDFNGKHYSMCLVNHLGLEESILEKRNDLESRGKLPRGRVFCLSIDEKETKVKVYSFTEKTFNYYHPNWVNTSLCKYRGTVENLQVKPVLALTQHFELDNVWDADGKWDARPSEDPIWQKAREIYQDSINLGVLKTEDVTSVVEKLVFEADTKFREAGANDDQIAVAPDYANALVEYVGKTGFRVGSVNDWNSPVLFCEGNVDVGYNAVIDMTALDFDSQNKFKTELCESLGFVGFDYVLDPDVIKQIDPQKIGTISLYIAPGESLAQAVKRDRIDPLFRYDFNEWGKERKHQEQLKTFASHEVKKAKDEYDEVFDLLSDVVSDKKLLAESIERLKARDKKKTEKSASVQIERAMKPKIR